MKESKVDITTEIRLKRYLPDMEKVIGLLVTSVPIAEAWGIKFRGKRIKLTHNNKSVWAKEQHAIAALSYQISGYFNDMVSKKDPGMTAKNIRRLYRDIINRLKEEGILEIVNLSE